MNGWIWICMYACVTINVFPALPLQVWLPAASPSSRGQIKSDTKAQRDDLALLQSVLRAQPFDAYQAYWSLADTKRQGVGLLIRKSIRSSPLENVWYSITEDGEFSSK